MMKFGGRPCPESSLGVPGTRWVIWCHYDTVAFTASKYAFEPEEMTGACRRGFVQESTRFIDSWEFETGGSETQTLLELAINMQDTRVQIRCSLYRRGILLAEMEHATQANNQNCPNCVLHRTEVNAALALSTVKAAMHSFAVDFLFSHPTDKNIPKHSC